MSKAEVQSFVALVLCCAQVLILLLGAHGVPDLLTRFISVDEVAFDENCHNDVPSNQTEKHFVSGSIVGLVVFPVDL